jgi:hypothetical protein
MSHTVDPVGAAPETRSVGFLTLMFGTCAAPLFWIGQLVLSYSITAYACYPGDHPVRPSMTGALFEALLVCDIVALLAAAAGAWVSWQSWRAARAGASHRHVLHTGEGRNSFLAIWGLLSSLWFFFAILFNAIASLMVPPCPN